MQKKKTAIITAKMTPQVKAEILRLSKRAGMTMTDYIVTCALNKEIVRVYGLEETMSELKSQGRNLNQLTTLANMGRIQCPQLGDLIDVYGELCRKLSHISREVE